ncbi:MAG: ribulose-phosphate 3-epimerase [Anaerolineales bacterium]
MIKIAPSIASANQSNLSRAVELAEAGGADLLHFDLEDGVFIPNLTFGPGTIRDLRPLSQLPFDVHLEVNQPESYFEAVVRAGADVVTVQFESTRFPYRALAMLKGMGVRAGLAFNAASSVEGILPVLDDLDVVHLMTAEPDGAGAAFIPGMEKKIERTAELCGSLPIEIEVDGGINADNISLAARAGATIFVVGRGIWSSDDVAGTIARLREAAQTGTAD